jgi:hypothetical protein
MPSNADEAGHHLAPRLFQCAERTVGRKRRLEIGQGIHGMNLDKSNMVRCAVLSGSAETL